MHDVGKIKVPDSVLNKPSRLTEDEFDLIKQHPLWSREILEEAELSDIAIDVASHHHEKLDGKGYPYGLSGDELSLHAQIICVADVYDALTAERVYKPGMTTGEAFKLMLKDCPIKLNEKLVRALISCIGLYPAGSLVELKSKNLALVTKTHSEFPLLPEVSVFYSIKHKRYIKPKTMDLANFNVKDEIISGVKPEKYNIDLNRFFQHAYPD